MKNTCDLSWRTWGCSPEGLYRFPARTLAGRTQQFPKISLDNFADKRREGWENLTLNHSSEGYWELINKSQGWPRVSGGCWSRSAEVFWVLWCVQALGVLLILSQGGKRKHTWDRGTSSSMYKSLLYVFRVFWQVVSLQECNCETCAIFYRMQWHKHLNRAGMWLARRIRLSSALCNRVFHRRFSCFIFLQLADCFCKP